MNCTCRKRSILSKRVKATLATLRELAKYKGIAYSNKNKTELIKELRKRPRVRFPNWKRSPGQICSSGGQFKNAMVIQRMKSAQRELDSLK